MKLKSTMETETYISEGGYYAIKQDDLMGSDPAIVLLSPDQMRAIVADMKDRIEDSAMWWSASENEK